MPVSGREMNVVARAQHDRVLADRITKAAGDDVAKLFAGMGHRILARRGAGRKYADARFEHAGNETSVEILKREAHFLVVNRVALSRAHDDQRLRRIAI